MTVKIHLAISVESFHNQLFSRPAEELLLTVNKTLSRIYCRLYCVTLQGCQPWATFGPFLHGIHLTRIKYSDVAMILYIPLVEIDLH